MLRLAGALLLAGLLSLAGCVSESERSPQELAVMRPPTPAATPRLGVLPRPLYFLSDRDGTTRVWRLERNGVTSRPVTAADAEVVCYDLAAQGQLAYATRDGALYVLTPGVAKPRIVVDLGERGPQTRFVSVSWSPDGRQLAYVLYTPEDTVDPTAYVDQVWADDGLWLHRLAGGADTQVLPNIAPDRISDRRRVIQAATWSPQGDALLVRMEAPDAGCYGIVELAEPYLLSVVDPQLSHTPLYGDVAWMPDGRMLLRGGANGDSCSLALVDRLSGRVMLLLDGQAAEMSVSFPHALPGGRVAFLMRGPGGQYRLHGGELSQMRLVHGSVSDEGLDAPLAAAWEPGAQGVALVTEGSAGERLIYVPLDGTPSIRLARDHPHPQQPLWQP